MRPIKTFYLLHHTHTDIGFTHDQPILWELHRRFLGRALDLAERDLGSDDPHAFRWTAESLGVVLHWLKHSSPRQIERFLRVVQAGRIEVTAMFTHNLPLADSAAQIEMLQYIGKIREQYGIPVRHALNCDINGHNWPLADYLLDAGIETLTMAINEFNGGAPFVRPNIFRWQTPAKRELLTLNNWIYNMGNYVGIDPLRNNPGKGLGMPAMAERLDRFADSIPALERILARAGWTLPIALLPCPHFFGDNAPPDGTLPDFVREWNRRGEGPQLCFATPTMWWDAVRELNGYFPLVSGDWTDYWVFGAIANAREVAVAKEAQVRLQTADALLAALPALEKSAIGDESWFALVPQYRAEAWEALHLWNEHTFESDAAIGNPDGIDSAALWNHKAQQAWKLHSLSKMLQRDSVAQLALQVRREADDLLLVYNPLPWERMVSGPVRDTLRDPRGDGGDAMAARHYQDHDGNVNARLLPTKLPPLGYALVKRDGLATTTNIPHSTETVMGNAWHKLTFDANRGGIAAWSDAAESCQWLDNNSPWKGATLIREEPLFSAGTDARSVFSSNADEIWTTEGHGRNWTHGWRAKRASSCQVISHQYERLPDGQRITQHLSFGEANLPVVEVRTFLPDYAPWVEFAVQYDMGLMTDPEAYYFALPFAVSQPAVRLDAGGQGILLNKEQLPGTNRDYFANHKWCAISDEQRNILIATPVNPLVMFGGFHFGANRETAVTDNGLFLGWLTNNYWICNFRARQPGKVLARYRVCPQQGKFSEVEAHRFGMDAAVEPVMHNLLEPAAASAALPESATLLNLPEPPILCTEMFPGWTDAQSIYLRLTNANDEPQLAVISSGILKITAANHCDFFGKPQNPLPINNGKLELNIAPRRTEVLQLSVS